MANVQENVKSFPIGIGPIAASAKNAQKAEVWAEGTDEQVSELGGTHSAKGWATSAAGYATDPNIVACGSNISSINTVASNISDVSSVAGINGSVSAVAGISADVTTVAGKKDDISTCANNIVAISAAPTSASDAAASAAAASNSSTNAQKWAEGADSAVTPMGGTHSAKGWAEQAQSIVSSLGTVLHYKGSVANYAALQAVTGQIVGDVYNVTDTGDNYAWDGSAWDKLSGTVDLSAYRTSAAQDLIDEGKQPTLVSGTNIKTVNSNSLLGSGNITIDSLPSQTGNNGKFLTTNGTTASWSQVVAYPTLTWFTGTTGTALSTTLDLANANLVKVYKNGMLLEDSNSPDAKIIKYTALNAGNRLLINTPFNFSAANTWEIDLKITTVYSNYGLTLIGGIKDYYYPGLSLTSGSIKSAYLFISSSGTAWNISNTQYAAGPYYEQQTYTVKASYDGAQYSVYNTNVATQETTGRVTATTTAKQIYDGDNSKITLLGYESSGNFNGTFYFSDFKIKLDNTVVFDGQTAEEGIDYTNYGCTKTEEYVYNKDYLISNNTINFSTALQATDKITVEVF